MHDSKLVAAFFLSLIIFNSLVFAEDGIVTIPEPQTGSSNSSSGGGSGEFITLCSNPCVLDFNVTSFYEVDDGDDIFIRYTSWTDSDNEIRPVLEINGATVLKREGTWVTVDKTYVLVQDITTGVDGIDYPQVTISFSEESPDEETPDNSGKNIIIWNADVGAWWSVGSAIYVTDYIIDKGVPVTVGVIPITGGGLYELGTDPELVDYLKDISSETGVEIALEGLKFEDNEFYGKTSSEVTNKINQGLNILSSSIYVQPDTFMPPYFVHDYNALEGARNAGITHFTAGWNAIEAGYAFNEYPSGLINTPVTTDTYNWDTGNLYTAEEIESSCQGAMDSFGTCAIIFQHHTFANVDGSIDQDKIQILSDVLDWAKDKESSGVTLKTVSGHSELEEPEEDTKKGLIIFRNDDIAPYWNVQNTITLTETIRESGVPQVISMIPVDPSGDPIYYDSDITSYIKSIKDDSNVEIAVHGYNHEVNEFENIGNLLTYQKITNAVNVYRYTFDGDAPSSFVPPYNLYNSYTIYNLILRDFDTISGGYTDINSGLTFKRDNMGIMHIPQTTDFYSWDENRHLTEEEIITSCENAIDAYGGCVFVVHHSLFTKSDGTIDEERMQILRDVMDWAKEKQSDGDAELTLFKDIDPASIPLAA